MGGASLIFWAGAIGLGLVMPILCTFMKEHRSMVMLGGLCSIIGALALSIPLKRLCNLIQHRLLRGKRLLNAKEYRGTYAA